MLSSDIILVFVTLLPRVPVPEGILSLPPPHVFRHPPRPRIFHKVAMSLLNENMFVTSVRPQPQNMA